MGLLVSCILIGSILLLGHALFSLYITLYAWDHPEAPEEARPPAACLPPQLSFTVLLPARREERVIGQTIRSIAAAHYTPELLEIIVICHADDQGTIREAEATAASMSGLGLSAIRVETFSDQPVNKPRALNVGLQCSSHQVVTIFDAEDDISPDIFSLVNTVMVTEGCDIVQAGVQLMNYDDHWFSIHNVLEYYFHFKSRMLFLARAGVTPLGGNTAFFRRELIERIGGWDEACLTEDADVGLRLSLQGKRARILFDPRYVTREETPPDSISLIRQQTRWHQGFLQILAKGQWRKLPSWRQRLLALYVFSYPAVLAAVTLAWPLAIAGWFWLKVPVVVALVSWLPMYVFLLQLLVTLVGAWLFTREYALRRPLLLPVRLVATFLPYHLLMGVSAVRAVYRQARRLTDWEKTQHIGAHRHVGQPDCAVQTSRPEQALGCEAQAAQEL